MLNSHQDAVFQAQLRALHHAAQTDAPARPVSATITALMRHGGLYSLLDADMMAARLGSIANAFPNAAGATQMAQGLRAGAASFFSRLVPSQPYLIPSSLMSYLVLPHEGVTYTEDTDEAANPAKYASPNVPAVTTFIGQFIDHDLTMNAVNLFEPQDATPEADGLPPLPDPIVDGASPLIDLDSVYGPRTTLASPASSLFEADGKTFVLARRNANGHADAHGAIFDLKREARTATGVIADHRNDENQMILQIHILVERMHNKFAETHDFKGARRQTILNWQYMLLHDHLPRVIQAPVLADVLHQISLPNFGNLKHKPCLDLATGKYIVTMPHEFAIAFRYGHSQLKRAYKVNGTSAGSELFNNRLTGTGEHHLEFDDLRGTQTLRGKNAIDWTVFYPSANPIESNLIDTKVTSRVYDLPESAIPDDIKYIGNLPHRNLIRSRQIGVCSGEALAKFYGIAPLTPHQVEKDESKHHLFRGNEATAHPTFETPLWYYILREAELSHKMPGDASKLGELGSRLVAEVIVGAIAYADISVLKAPHFTPLPGAPDDHMRTIIKWVNGLSTL